MTKKDDFNIFDLSSKRNKIPPKKPAAAAPSTAKPEEVAKPALPAPSSAEVEKMMERMKLLRQEIEAKVEEIYEKSGMTPKELEKFLDGLETPEKKKLDEESAALENKVWEVLGKGAKERKEKKQADQSSKSRKAKMVGARKRWISTK